MSDLPLIDAAPIEIALPPTQDELPSDDAMPMETERHKLQMDLLIYSLRPWIEQRAEGGYVGGNMFIYFSISQVRGQAFRGPDVFAVLGVPPGERKCWVVWEEGKGPDVVIELLSARTAAFDKGEKRTIYQNQVRVPQYYWFDPFAPDDWAGFELRGGVYQPVAPDQQGRMWSERLGLGLVRWRGRYEGVDATWLRWVTQQGELLPTRAEAAQQRAEIAQQRAEAAEAEVARLRALLASRTA